MSPRRQAELDLKTAGFVRVRGNKHDVWRDPETGLMIPLRHGSDFDENDLRTICKEMREIIKRREPEDDGGKSL